MKFKLGLIILLAALLAHPGLSQAQNNFTPIILLLNSDLWSYDGETLQNITNDGHITDAVLSPDGTQIAYVTLSPISVEAVEHTGGIGGGPLPSDIKVMDRHTFEILTIAEQPADASFFVDGVPDNAILRSLPAWSANCTRLAWGEIHYPSFAPETNRLVMYDFTEGSTVVWVTQLPEQAGAGPRPVTPTWGRSQIAVASYEFDPVTSTFFTEMLVYDDQDARLISSTRLFETDSRIFSSYVWVIDSNGQDQIAVETMPSGTWELMDPLTGRTHAALGVPKRVNPFAPQSAAISFAYHPDAKWPEFYSWAVTYPGGQQIESQNRVSSMSHVTIGPDGQAMAQITSDGLLTILWPDGQVTEGPVLENRFATVYWGAAAWRIDQPAPCGSALPPRLVVGNMAFLIPETTPNNLRSTPSTGEVLGQIQPGADMTVLAGPECADGMYWWQVDYEGTVGWTAEGNSSEYWLEPAIG